MRAAVGEGCHILECGPGNMTVGLIDSMRIEADLNYGYAAAAWKQYFQDPACSLGAAAKRYYFHRRTWVNDADHVCLDLLAPQQAEAAATSIALSGGNMISGDRLVDLDPVKFEILKKITAVVRRGRRSRRPLRCGRSHDASCGTSNGRSQRGRWSRSSTRTLDVAVERRFAFRRLGLDPAKTYLAFDFWKQRFSRRGRRTSSA